MSQTFLVTATEARPNIHCGGKRRKHYFYLLTSLGISAHSVLVVFVASLKSGFTCCNGWSNARIISPLFLFFFLRLRFSFIKKRLDYIHRSPG